jgi:hypothetical protein
VTGSGGSGAYGSSGTGGQYTPSPTTGGISAPPSAGMVQYHDGIESGLVGGLPMPKNWEVVAKLAKGEGVFTAPQMNNISNYINNSTPNSSGSSSNIVNNINVQATLSNGYDVDNMTKDLARSMEKQIMRRGVRI